MQLLKVPAQTRRASAGLLLLRAVAGLAFVFHGATKIVDPFGWRGPDSSTPGPLQALAAMSELGGGAGWILGLLVPLSSAGIACTMAVAVSMHMLVRHDPFVDPGGSSYELAAVYLCVSLLLLLAGPGRYSLDRVLFGERRA